MKTLKSIKANALTKEQQKNINGGGDLIQYMCTRANGSVSPAGAYSQEELNSVIDRTNARCNKGFEIVGCEKVSR